MHTLHYLQGSRPYRFDSENVKEARLIFFIFPHCCDWRKTMGSQSEIIEPRTWRTRVHEAINSPLQCCCTSCICERADIKAGGISNSFNYGWMERALWVGCFDSGMSRSEENSKSITISYHREVWYHDLFLSSWKRLPTFFHALSINPPSGEHPMVHWCSTSKLWYGIYLSCSAARDSVDAFVGRSAGGNYLL